MICLLRNSVLAERSSISGLRVKADFSDARFMLDKK
jgi:hypothetical protein